MKIKGVAKLARLNLSEEEEQKFSKQLGGILSYIEKLNQLDTEKVKPTAHILPMKNIWREDKVKPSLNRNDIIRNMPQEHEGFFKVPPVIE